MCQALYIYSIYIVNIVETGIIISILWMRKLRYKSHLSKLRWESSGRVWLLTVLTWAGAVLSYCAIGLDWGDGGQLASNTRVHIHTHTHTYTDTLRTTGFRDRELRASPPCCFSRLENRSGGMRDANEEHNLLKKSSPEEILCKGSAGEEDAALHDPHEASLLC